MKTGAATPLAPLAALALAACAAAPESDQTAQATMIGLSARDVLACMGRPAHRSAPAQATEIWTYRSGVTTTSSPPWGPGLNFSELGLATPCDVSVVLTNAHVSQVSYALPDGRALRSGRQCAFAVSACAERGGAR